MNVSVIMQNAAISKGIIFDKILINTFRRCSSLMELNKANEILSVDNITQYFSINDNYISINPDDYRFTSIPSFSDSDKQILALFYGVNY